MFYNLAAEQARKGKTDTDMAIVLNISRETFNRKKKNHNFSFFEIKKLCKYFGKGFDYLFATDEQQTQEQPKEPEIPIGIRRAIEYHANKRQD